METKETWHNTGVGLITKGALCSVTRNAPLHLGVASLLPSQPIGFAHEKLSLCQV